MGSKDCSSHAPSSFLASFLLLLLFLVAGLVLFRSVTRNSIDLSSYSWVYLRDSEPLISGDGVVEVIALGDVMLGRGAGDEPRPFAAVAPLLKGADLTLGNLECVIANDPASRVPGDINSPGPLQAAPSVTRRLARVGFDVLGLANNHTLDLGTAGLTETASRLEAVGIATVGAGPDRMAAFQPLVREIDGVRLAFLAVNAVKGGRDDQDGGWVRAEWDSQRIATAIKAARDQADAVIVSVHWGYEYERRVDPIQRGAAELLFESGADLVIGHHPHVVQAFEISEGRCVAYSLGNFVFDQGQGQTRHGLALRAFFDREGLRAVQAVPVWAGPQPRLMTPEASGATQSPRALPARLGPPQRSSFTCDEGGCRRVDMPSHELEETRSTLFWGGRIDLTGDGVLEHVRRVGGQVVIYSDGAEVWLSPATWRVVDVGLGDPNNDGRGEILLALWKTGLDGLETPSPEKERTPRSHPFIVGYRGGSYRTLWGGSAVSDPIHEVELGDVDNDGVEELIVLEGEDPEKRTLSVWRWHGWGFTLMWRSDPVAYHSLSLSDRGVFSAVVESALP